MQSNGKLSTNSIAFIGLCNEYCAAIERCDSSEQQDFVAEMLRLLPRIYITATDLKTDADYTDDNVFIDDALDESRYDIIRQKISALMGADDTYLEVFEEDMKYSDTPIAASVSEGLADLMQVAFNLIATVRDAPSELIPSLIAAVKEDFDAYWSRIICNVMRPLNQIRYAQ